MDYWAGGQELLHLHSALIVSGQLLRTCPRSVRSTPAPLSLRKKLRERVTRAAVITKAEFHSVVAETPL